MLVKIRYTEDANYGFGTRWRAREYKDVPESLISMQYDTLKFIDCDGEVIEGTVKGKKCVYDVDSNTMHFEIDLTHCKITNKKKGN